MLEGKSINWTGSGSAQVAAEEEKKGTSISAQIIADSTSYLHKRLTTFVLEYPRYIHSELMTHRVFSKNSASSRAIPYSKFVEMVEKNPVMPVWTQNQAGMQGPVITDKGTIQGLNRIWFDARFDIIKHANKLNTEGVHKQNINRLLEPWMHIRIVLTGTEFDNWFELRDHPAAHPEIQALARAIKEAYEGSTPVMLQPGEWHIPYGDNIPELEYMKEGYVETATGGYPVGKLYAQLRTSVARCARVSYNNFDGASSYAKDAELYSKLLNNRPLHASPAEHQARVPHPNELQYLATGWHYGSNCPEEQEEWTEKRGKYFSNLVGWIQLRKLIECKEFV